MTSQRKRQLAAIMFTDMVGYTALMQKDEQKAKLKRDRHREILQKFTAEHHGEILQYYGDGTLSIFPSVIEAVLCAMEIQEAFLQKPRVPLRVGIHTGDIVYDEEGAYGDGVNIASRIENMSVAGSVLISEKVYDDVKNHKEIQTKPLGKFELKNVKHKVGVFALTNEGLIVPDLKKTNGSNGNSEKSIAVLPFTNMSSDPENEYFSDGITEEILNALTRVEGLKVTARTSSFAFKGKNEDIRSIGKQLNVENVLEGSVRKAGNKVRITAQLINTADGYHLWSEVFDRDFEDVFALQDEISEKVTNKLRAQFMPAQKPKEKQPSDDAGAYNEYLKGLYHWRKWTPEDSWKAIKIFESVIEKTPDFALAHTGLATCCTMAGMKGQARPDDVFPKAEKAVEKALKLAPDLAESHMAKGLLLMVGWDLKDAEKHIKKALELNPNLVEALIVYGFFLAFSDRTDESLQYLKRAVEIDPLSLSNMRALANGYLMAKQYDKAIELYNRVLDMDPNDKAAIECKGFALLDTGKHTEGLKMFEQYQSMPGDSVHGQASLGVAYAMVGQKDKALESLEKLKRMAASDKEHSYTTEIAMLYAALEDLDKAFEYVEKALDEGHMPMTFLKPHPPFNLIQADPRFDKLMEKFRKRRSEGASNETSEA